jgi:CelD/BcsL family acetyltransferase involved in cellulose biosynthesis
VTVETATAIEPLEAEWSALAAETGAAPWARPGWVAAWWSAFGKGALELVTVRRDGRLAAVVPLAARLGGAVAPTNWHTPGFEIVAADDDARHELVAAVLRRGFGHVSVGFLDRAGADVEVLRRGAAAAGYRTLERRLTQAPYLPLDGDFDSYLAAGGIGKKPLKELMRRRTRLEERASLEFVVSDGADDLEALLGDGFAIEGSGWKDENGTAIRSRPDTLRFYTDVARWARREGLLRLLFLRLDGRPIAFVFALQDTRALYDVKAGYDVEFRTSSPGKLIAYEMIRHAYEEGLETFEFLGAADPFKLEWTQSVRERVLLQAFAPVKGLPAFAAYRYGRPAGRRARSLARRGAQVWRRPRIRLRRRA